MEQLIERLHLNTLSYQELVQLENMIEETKKELCRQKIDKGGKQIKITIINGNRESSYYVPEEATIFEALKTGGYYEPNNAGFSTRAKHKNMNIALDLKISSLLRTSDDVIFEWE